MKSQNNLKKQGFATLFLLTLLPVIICGLLIVYVTTFHVMAQQKINATCRTGLMQGQKNVSQILSLLWLTNEPAELLIRFIQLLRVAEIGEIVSIYGIVELPKTEQTIQRIKKIQKQLGAFQRSLILSAELASLKSEVQTSNEIRNSLKSISNLPTHFINLNYIQVLPSLHHRLKIHKKYEDEVASPYVLDSKNDFIIESKIHWFYKETLNSTFSNWLSFSKNILDNCKASSIQKGSFKWQPTLN